MRVVWVVFVKEFLDIVRNRRRFIWMLLSSFVIFPLLFVTPYALLLGRMAEQTVSAITIPAQGLDNAPALAAFLENEKDIKLTPAKDVEKLVRDALTFLHSDGTNQIHRVRMGRQLDRKAGQAPAPAVVV